MPDNNEVLNEVVRLLGSVPDKATFRHDLAENHAWFGAVLHILRQSDDLLLAGTASSIVRSLSDKPITIRDPRSRLIVLLEQIKREFELKCGYVIPRNYLELTADAKQDLNSGSEELHEAITQDNELSQEDKSILIAEIAVFEASLVAPKLSTELMHRFVFGVLKGSIIKVAGAIIQKLAARLADNIIKLMQWYISS